MKKKSKKEIREKNEAFFKKASEIWKDKTPEEFEEIKRNIRKMRGYE